MSEVAEALPEKAGGGLGLFILQSALRFNLLPPQNSILVSSGVLAGLLKFSHIFSPKKLRRRFNRLSKLWYKTRTKIIDSLTFFIGI